MSPLPESIPPELELLVELLWDELQTPPFNSVGQEFPMADKLVLAMLKAGWVFPDQTPGSALNRDGLLEDSGAQSERKEC
jgi:hypothetical protein